MADNRYCEYDHPRRKRRIKSLAFPLIALEDVASTVMKNVKLIGRTELIDVPVTFPNQAHRCWDDRTSVNGPQDLPIRDVEEQDGKHNENRDGQPRHRSGTGGEPS